MLIALVEMPMFQMFQTAGGKHLYDLTLLMSACKPEQFATTKHLRKHLRGKQLRSAYHDNEENLAVQHHFFGTCTMAGTNLIITIVKGYRNECGK